jgi:hypothetical protein
MVETKYCRHCGIEKPILNFESRRDVKGGRSHKCQDCSKNKIHVYTTPPAQLIRQQKMRKTTPKVVQYFEHDPYYQL